MVTKFRQHAKNLNNVPIVASIATYATQNYSHWSYFIILW